MIKRFQTSALFASSMMVLAACGGGSSSGGGTTTPTTPVMSTNQAPSASISVTDMMPLEGKSSMLDATNSSDPDGDNLTFSWTQLSGPGLSFTSPNLAETEVLVPNLTVDAAARIQLQVSDGDTTSSEEITLNLTNLVLSPIQNSELTVERQFPVENPIFSIPTVFYFSETVNLLAYETDDAGAMDLFGYDSDNELVIYEPQEYITNANSFTTQATPSPRGINWIAGFEDTRISFYEPLTTPERLSVDVDAPCSLVGDPNRSAERTFIGSRTGKNILIEFTGSDFTEPTDTSELLSFAPDAALCEMQIMGDDRLVAFDQNTNNILTYLIERNDDFQIIGLLGEPIVVEIDLDLPEGTTINFIDSTKLGQNAMALVFSDGETEGVHRMVIIREDPDASIFNDRSILQETYSWEYGSPSEIISVRVDDDGVEELLITTTDSPYSAVFSAGASNLSYADAEYFDLGVGHGVVAPIVGGSPARSGLIVSFPGENLIKVLERQ